RGAGRAGGPCGRCARANRRLIAARESTQPGAILIRPSDGRNGRGPAGFLMPRDVILTPEGLEELKAKIEHLSGPRRREVAERIKEAREFGDISENSEYDDAKNEQAMLEKQIAELEEKLRSA